MQKPLLLRLEHPLFFAEVSNEAIKNYHNGIGRTIVLSQVRIFNNFFKKNAAIGKQREGFEQVAEIHLRFE